jgi:Spy/CpxP family protein refolding chaperone
MKTWIKRSLIGLAAVATLSIGAAAVAHRHGGWHGPMNDADLGRAKTHLVERIADRMDLDAGQRQQLDLLGEQLLVQRKALMAGSEPRAALQALVAGNSFDRAGAEALLMAKTDALGAAARLRPKPAARRAGAPAVIAAFGDFYDGLRPEQQTQLREQLARGRHDGRHEGRRGGRDRD